MTIDKKLSIAILNSTLGKYSYYLVYAASIMVLARVFTPQQFGIFASIQIFVVFFSLLAEMGLTPAIISLDKVKPSMRDGLFTISLLVGSLLATTFLFLGPFFDWFYSSESYNQILLPLSLSIIFSSLSTVPVASLQREKKFILIAKCNSISELLTLGLVLLLHGVVEPLVALCSKPFLTSLFQLLFLWSSSKKTETGRAKFSTNIIVTGYITSFSINQLGANILNYLSKSIDSLLVAKYFGITSLAIYDKAYQLFRYPLMMLTFAMSPAIQPVVKEIRYDRIEFERLHAKLLNTLIYISLFIGFFIFIYSKEIVVSILGEQWLESAIILKILSISLPFQITWNSSAGFFQAVERTDLLFKSGLISALINTLAVVIGIHLGDLEGLSWCLVFSSTITFLIGYAIFSCNILKRGLIGFISDLKIGLGLSILFLAYGVLTLF